MLPHRQTHRRRVVVSTDLVADSANIMGSRAHIRKILMNLVANGFEAIDSSGEVTISLDQQHIEALSHRKTEIEKGDYVVLTVGDQGKGISSEDLEKIFELFLLKEGYGQARHGAWPYRGLERGAGSQRLSTMSCIRVHSGAFAMVIDAIRVTSVITDCTVRAYILFGQTPCPTQLYRLMRPVPCRRAPAW